MKSSNSDSEKNNIETYDEFYATMKLITGEEVLALVVIDKKEKDQVVIENPVICKEIKVSGSNIPMGYKFEPWMKMSTDETYIINSDKIVTISEITNKHIIKTYKNLISKGWMMMDEEQEHSEVSKKMGYISSVKKARLLLEKSFRNKSFKKDSKDTKDT